MVKKLNGTAKWIIVTIAVLTVGFNTGVTYNHVHELGRQITKLEEAYEKMDDKLDQIMLKLAGGYNAQETNDPTGA